MDILQPPGWVRPKGYSNGVSATGKLVVTGGMVGWNHNEEFVQFVIMFLYMKLLNLFVLFDNY